jgi:hypothetical protein
MLRPSRVTYKQLRIDILPMPSTPSPKTAKVFATCRPALAYPEQDDGHQWSSAFVILPGAPSTVTMAGVLPLLWKHRQKLLRNI